MTPSKISEKKEKEKRGSTVRSSLISFKDVRDAYRSTHEADFTHADDVAVAGVRRGERASVRPPLQHKQT